MTALCASCAQVVSADTAIELYNFLVFVVALSLLFYLAPFKDKPQHIKAGMAVFYFMWALILGQTFSSLAATYYTTVIVVLDYLERTTSLTAAQLRTLEVAFYSLPFLIFLNAAFYLLIHRRLARAGGEDECQ